MGKKRQQKTRKKAADKEKQAKAIQLQKKDILQLNLSNQFALLSFSLS